MALITEYKADPKRLAQAWNLDMAKDQAQINASNSSAAASSALAKGRSFELEQEKVLADPKATADAVEAAARMFQKGKTDKSAANASVETQKKLVREANPTWTEQQIAEDVLTRSASAKTDNLRYAMKVLEDPMNYSEATVASAKSILDNHLTTAAKGKGGAKGGTEAPPGNAAAGTMPPVSQRVVGVTKFNGKTWVEENGQRGWK